MFTPTILGLLVTGQQPGAVTEVKLTPHQEAGLTRFLSTFARAELTASKQDLDRDFCRVLVEFCLQHRRHQLTQKEINRYSCISPIPVTVEPKEITALSRKFFGREPIGLVPYLRSHISPSDRRDWVRHQRDVALLLTDIAPPAAFVRITRVVGDFPRLFTAYGVEYSTANPGEEEGFSEYKPFRFVAYQVSENAFVNWSFSLLGEWESFLEKAPQYMLRNYTIKEAYDGGFNRD